MASKKPAKKKTPKVMEPPLTKYPYVRNRCLVVDWASLSYHQLHSIASHANREKYGLLSMEGELELWRNKMFGKMLEYIKLFNPMHIILCLEGGDAWRKKFVRKYYTEHADVYYDATTYYVSSDNYAYSVTKCGEMFKCVRIKPKDYAIFESMKHRKLGELPREKQKMLWNIYTSSGDPILPSYKGHRGKNSWPFLIDRNEWRAYKDEYAKSLAYYFRARAVTTPRAEGDDMIYGAVQEYAGESDDVIIITGDSDMSQIDHPKVKIFNHRTSNFVNCAYPKEYLDAKVLAGDSSDNINGMAFIDVRTGMRKFSNPNQVGEGTSIQLMEACPNIYETAKRYGWDDQYMRNRMLIDLSMVPGDVKAEIREALHIPEPAFPTMEMLNEWNITDMFIRRYNQMRTVGFYTLLPAALVEKDPGVFHAELVSEVGKPEDPYAEYKEHMVSIDVTSPDMAKAFNVPDFGISVDDFSDDTVPF